jgi:hypothetical protein
MTSINAQIRMPSKMASDDGEDSCGSSMQEVTSRYTPVKTSAWENSRGSFMHSFKGFWMDHHNLRRHPFAPPGEPKRPETKSFWSDFKGFWMTHHNLRRHPFADRV